MDISNSFGLAPILMNEADGGEGGGGGAAVATVETSVATTAGDGGDGTGGEETALTTTEGDGTTQGGDGTVARKTEHPGLAALKAHEDPEVKKFANTATRAVAFRRDVGAMFPGVNPIAAIKSLQADMVGLAGRNWNTPDPRDEAKRTGIQQIKDRLAEIEEIDLMFYGGDQRLLDGMTSDDEGKAAFVKLAPHMLAKWRDLAPKSFAAALARQMVADMNGRWLKNDKGEDVVESDVAHRIRRMSLALGREGVPTELDLKIVRDELSLVAAYAYQLQLDTNLAPEVLTQATEKADTKLAERERRIAEREAQNRDADWNSARQIVANQTTTKTWNQLTKGHEISADDQEECISLFHIRFNAAIKAKEPRADEQRKGYIESDDRDGYLAYENYLMTTYGVPALKEQVKRMLAKMQPLKPGQTRATATTTTTAAATATRPAQGYTKIGEKPPLHVIDNNGRTREMVMAKQATLRVPWKDFPAGKKICW